GSFHRALSQFRSNNVDRPSGVGRWSAAKRGWRAQSLRTSTDQRESVGRGVGVPWVEQCSRRGEGRAAPGKEVMMYRSNDVTKQGCNERDRGQGMGMA